MLQVGETPGIENGADAPELADGISVLNRIDFRAGIPDQPTPAKLDDILAGKIVDHYANLGSETGTDLGMPRTYHGLLAMTLGYEPVSGRMIDEERWIVARMYLGILARAKDEDTVPIREPSSRIHTPRLSLTAKQLQTNSY